MTPAEAARWSTRIAERFFENIDLAGIRVLLTFIRISKFNEIDTSVIYYRIWRDLPHLVTAAPRIVLASGEIVPVVFDADSSWSESKWGIREPVDGEALRPDEIDLALVPLLCFDEQGHRIGYGKGMFDRFLSKCRPECRKIGLSYFPPIEAIEDAWEGDIKLDACVTPNNFYSLG